MIHNAMRNHSNLGVSMNRLLLLVLLLGLVACDQGTTPTQSLSEDSRQIQSSTQGPSTATNTEVDAQTAIQLNDNVDLGIPVGNNQHSEILISRKQYVLSYNHINRVLNWAAWKLELKHLGIVKRGKFAPDQLLHKYLQEQNLGKGVVTTDYTNSCFNRGHTVPSADRNATNDDNNATFLMSNITPQTAFLNQVAWGHLEYYERALAQQGKTLYIYAGPIYEREMGGIGSQADIKIPTKFFKIIVEFDALDTTHTITKNTPMTVVIMPNTTSAGTYPDEDRETLCNDAKRLPSSKANFDDWKKYQTTIEDVEKQTGLKFFEENSEQILSPIIVAA